MRTEEQLRTALVEVADAARPSDDLYATILRRTARQGPHRRRVVLLVAVAAAVLVAALVIPTVLTQRTVVPADQRVPGNWNTIHRVELPPGWTLRSIAIHAASESSEVGPVRSDPSDQTGGCFVGVYARGLGDPAADATDRKPVDVNGRAGEYAAPGRETQGGVIWRYTDEAFAQVACEDEPTSIEIARRVRFEPSTVRLPFRLERIPEGYQARSVYPQVSIEGTPRGGVELTGTDPARDLPSITVIVWTGTTERPPGLPGWETDTIAGQPAVLSARDSSLCLNPPGHTVCVDSDDDPPADLTQSLWPADRRELLVSVAESLTLAERLDDPSTWHEANEALPR